MIQSLNIKNLKWKVKESNQVKLKSGRRRRRESSNCRCNSSSWSQMSCSAISRTWRTTRWSGWPRKWSSSDTHRCSMSTTRSRWHRALSKQSRMLTKGKYRAAILLLPPLQRRVSGKVTKLMCRPTQERDPDLCRRRMLSSLTTKRLTEQIWPMD